MKWLVLVLIILNAGVWYFSGASQAPQVSGAVVTGSLPRVASLKSTGPAPASPVSPAPQEQPVPEPAASDVFDAGLPESESSESEAVVAEVVPVPLSCVQVGWIDSIEQAQALVARQSDADALEVTFIEQERELTPYHWVIIPPQPRAVALKQFRDIQRQGIDSYLVTEGENRNAISLGLFESRQAAISVLEEKKRQNLNVVLVNFPRNQISYALVFKAEPKLAKELAQAVEADYDSNFDFIEISPCEGVATSQKNP